MEQAAISKASAVYWLSCTTEDQHLLQELKTAADAAHNRNDGAEQQTCLEGYE